MAEKLEAILNNFWTFVHARLDGKFLKKLLVGESRLNLH